MEDKTLGNIEGGGTLGTRGIIPEGRKKQVRLVSIGLFFILLVYYIGFHPARGFQPDSLVQVKGGATLSEVVSDFEKENLVSSSFLLDIFVRLFGSERSVMAGDYFFEKPQGVVLIAWRITHGEYELKPIRVTIVEGLNVFEIADILDSKIPVFDKKAFIATASPHEGYLFPDTYLFLPNVSNQVIIKSMTDNFSQKIKSVDEELSLFGKPLNDVIIIASIVEDEARQLETRQTVAGILWKRLALGVPLQVDAAFKRINGKDTSNLTLDDLQIDSPYNTYKYKGLPPTAISNPGLDSIIATVTPIKTPYLYFLTDKDGVMHYAKTFEEHSFNKELYLR